MKFWDRIRVQTHIERGKRRPQGNTPLAIYVLSHPTVVFGRGTLAIRFGSYFFQQWDIVMEEFQAEPPLARRPGKRLENLLATEQFLGSYTARIGTYDRYLLAREETIMLLNSR